MSKMTPRFVALLSCFSLGVLVGGCAPAPSDGGTGGSGAPGSGGSNPGATGGSPAATGGTPAATGGSPAATGGPPAATGGTPAATGGAPGSGGAVSSGGAPAATGGRDASTGGGANGGRAGGGSNGAAGTVGAGGQSANCPSNALVCDDFEDGDLAGWTQMAGAGTLAIDSVHASSGKNALGITLASGARGGWLQRTGSPLFPLPNNAIYGRMMVYFESLPAGHTDFVRASATNGQTPWYNVGEQSGKIMLNYYASGSDCWARPSPSTNIPLNSWMCWEWAYNGPMNQMQFYVNSTLSRMVNGSGDGCTGSNVWTAPTFNHLAIGAYNAQPGNAPSVGKMWFDDIAVGTSGRIACPTAGAP